MRFQSRSAFGWPASAAGRATPTKGLVIHYDGSNQGLARKAHSSCVAYWKSTRSFHMGPARGWADIGYSYGACPHGYVMEGRGLDRIQAAQPGGNDTWYSVTLMSGPGEDPTPAQIDAVRQLRAWLMGKGVAGAVRGHRDFISTSCPGDRLYRLVKDGAFAKAPSEEDDVSAEDVWNFPIDTGDGGKPWYAKTVLGHLEKSQDETHAMLKQALAKLDAQHVTIDKLVDALKAAQPDLDALKAEIREAIESVRVRLDVED